MKIKVIAITLGVLLSLNVSACMLIQPLVTQQRQQLSQIHLKFDGLAKSTDVFSELLTSKVQLANDFELY